MKTRVSLKYFVNNCRYLVILGAEKYDFIYNSIRCLIWVKSGITYINSHSCAKIKVDSQDSLPLEKTMTVHNVIILIRSVFNEYIDNYYCNIFLEKALHELPKK